MIEIIDPNEVLENLHLIKRLKRYGINHLSNKPSSGWNYALDHYWVHKKVLDYLRDKNSIPIILDIGCGKNSFHNFLENEIGFNILGIDRPEGYCNQAYNSNIDFYINFEKLNVFLDNSIDIIIWISSIEHNSKEEIIKLVNKSMRLLKPNGLFLATIPISEETKWFEPSEQTNLSLEDCIKIFNSPNVIGDFAKIKQKYRNNILNLHNRYKNRYGKFDSTDPAFITGGIEMYKK